MSVPTQAAPAPGSPEPPPTTDIPAPVPPPAPQPAGLPQLQDGIGPSATDTQAMMTAAAQARSGGQPVSVATMTTETRQVTAQPRGGFQLTTTPLPVRTRHDGVWVKVDTTLHLHAGRLAAAATAYGAVTFSDGGTGPLAITTSGAITYSVSWPAGLPTPTVSGSTATYPNVYPGVDLTVTANVTGGFSDVLVVHDAQAGRNPHLANLALPTTVTGGRVTNSGAGITVTGRANNDVLQASAPTMWDSNTSLTPPLPAHVGPRPATPTTGIAADPSDLTHPGLAAHIAPLGVRADARTLRLTPDRSLLTGRSTVFPVYIDPTFVWHQSTSTKPSFDEVKQGAPCNHVPYFNDAGSDANFGQLGVGVNIWDGCVGIDRSYYQWGFPSTLWGATINTATVSTTEVYSASCSASANVYLHWSGGIGPGTDWNNKPGDIGTAVINDIGPSRNPDLCPAANLTSSTFNVKSMIASSASAHATGFTVVLAEDANEVAHNSTGFKRFADNPVLQISYDFTPRVPATSQMSVHNGSAIAACATATPYPFIGKSIASATSSLAATISDPDRDHVQAHFRYWLDGASSTSQPVGLSADNIASGGLAQFNLPPTFIAGLTNGQVVDWQAQVTDGQLTSAWSPVCHFTAEPTAPDAPTITSADGTYPDTDADGTVGATAGTPGTFTLATTGTTAATKYVYALDQQPPTSAPPTADIVTPGAGGTATVTVTPLNPGPHSLFAYAADAAGDISGFQSYHFLAAADAGTTCTSLAACYDNTAITSDANPAQGSAGGGFSFSATDWTNAGWTSGGKITVNGATFTLPTFGSGQADNVLAANQTIPFSQALPTTGTSSLEFLATSTTVATTDPGDIAGDTTAPYVPAGTAVAGTYCFDSDDSNAYCPAAGHVTYSDGTTAPYDLDVPDWTVGPTPLAAAVFPRQNSATGGRPLHAMVFEFSVPLAAGQTLSSITLPDIGRDQFSSQVLHIFGIAVRNTTTANAPAGTTWTGAWANPNEGSYNFEGGTNYSNQTFRLAIKPSVSGSSVRIKLDDALGTAPLTIGHATIAHDTPTTGTPSAVPTALPTSLTFGGAQSVTIPEGGMVYSDPLPFTVTADQYLLVSFTLTNSVPFLVEHSWANTGYQYVAAIGSGDHSTDTTGTPFTGTGTHQGWFTDLVTNIDVATNNIPTQAVLGNALTDAWAPNTTLDQTTGLADDLVAAEPTTPGAFGVIAEGIESNQVMTDNPETHNGGPAGGPALLSRIDRDLLDQPNVHTVVLYEGLEDVLNGRSADELTADGYSQLINYLQNADTDIDIIAVGLPPCDGYIGGAPPNDPCTATVDQQRQQVNGWLSSGPDQLFPPQLSYLDPDTTIGVPDTTNGETKLNPIADEGDHVNLTAIGSAAITSTYFGPQDTWPLDDGPGNTTANDTAAANDNPYLANNPEVGANPATLSPTATWATDPTRGTVLQLDGTNADAQTTTPVLDTTHSFSISTWAMLTSTTTSGTIASQDATQTAGFQLGYDATRHAWTFTMPTTDTTTPTMATAASTTTPTTGTWTHLVGTYNAINHTLTLYVNGTPAATATNTTPIPSTGPFTLGRTHNATTPTGFFTGDISNTQAWNYTLAPDQITALFHQVT